MIDENIECELFRYLGGVCNNFDCVPIKVGGYLDHVHILCKLSRKYPIMDILEEIKKRSSKWIKTKGDQYAGFYWQNGYFAISVDPKSISRVVKYIETQKEHHQKQSFKEECRIFFKEYNIEI